MQSKSVFIKSLAFTILVLTMLVLIFRMMDNEHYPHDYVSEALLTDLDEFQEVYRFIGFYFGMSGASVVTIGKSKSSYEMRSKQSMGLDFWGNYRFVETRQSLSELQWKQMLSLIDTSDFWNLSYHADYVVMDGNTCFLEALKLGGMHSIVRYSPAPEGMDEVLGLCDFFAKTAGFHTMMMN